MKFDRKYLILSLCYAAVGMCLGIYMAASQNHSQFVTHAHILLVGFVASFIYAIIHKLWLSGTGKKIAMTQFVVHHLSTIAMFIGLLVVYGAMLPAEKMDPVLGAASIGVLVAALLMLYMVLKSDETLH
jgi:multisubunit Na+/H+ antiporter MnhF subunit